MSNDYYVYILEVCSRDGRKFWGKSKIYYTGMTENIVRRYNEHLSKRRSQFLSKNLPNSMKKLVYVERLTGQDACYHALEREKTVKKYPSSKKNALINSDLNVLICANPKFGRVGFITLKNGDCEEMLK